MFSAVSASLFEFFFDDSESRGRHSRSHTSVTSMSINVAKWTFLCLTMNMLCILLL